MGEKWYELFWTCLASEEVGDSPKATPVVMGLVCLDGTDFPITQQVIILGPVIVGCRVRSLIGF